MSEIKVGTAQVRAVLDTAIDMALPASGGAVRKRLKQLRRALAEGDAQRAATATRLNLGDRVRVIHVAPEGCDDCSVEPGEQHRHAGCPGNRRQALAVTAPNSSGGEDRG